MSPFTLAITVPLQNSTLFTQIAWALFGLFLFAILVELIRRHHLRQRRKEEIWDRVERIARQKGLSNEHMAFLLDFLERRAPEHPILAATDRKVFSVCVDAELRSLEDRGDVDTYESTGELLRQIRIHLGLGFIPIGQPIQSTRELREGQLLWIAPIEQHRGSWFRVRVAAVDEAHFSLIPWPGTAEDAPPIEPGQRVRCRMWRTDDARYVFEPEVMHVEGPPLLWVFHHTAELKRIQSREYYRVHVENPTTVAVLEPYQHRDAPPLPEQAIASQFGGTITSLSGGGIAIVGSQAVPTGRIVRASIKLPGETVFPVHAEVVDVSRLSDNRHLVRCRFVDIDEDHRELVARYVLQRQQMLLAREEGSPWAEEA